MIVPLSRQKNAGNCECGGPCPEWKMRSFHLGSKCQATVRWIYPLRRLYNSHYPLL
jgi:hypothetical protein